MMPRIVSAYLKGAITGVVLDVDQRSDAWRIVRLGKLTGSVAGDMLATVKSGGEAAARRDLRLRLAVERLTGRPVENGFVSRHMQRGVDLEPLAVGTYEARTGTIVVPVGFIGHPTLAAGCSPDGIVDDGNRTGIVECKCPKSTTHFAYLRANVLPPEYRGQVLHNMWISGAAFCDFVSFDDRFPPALQYWAIRVERNDVEIDAYELMARAFLTTVDREVDALRASGFALV